MRTEHGKITNKATEKIKNNNSTTKTLRTTCEKNQIGN